MLVYLTEQPHSAFHHYRPENTMDTPLGEYRSQIIDNCEFMISKDDFVSVITKKNAIGYFKAYAVRSSEDSREALLSSGPKETIRAALASLLDESCQAANYYICTNGFSYPPDLQNNKCKNNRINKNDDDDDDDDDLSVVSGHSMSSTAALSWGDSDDEVVKMPAPSTSNEKSKDSIKHRGKLYAMMLSSGEDDEQQRRPVSLPPHAKLLSPLRSPSTANTTYRAPPPPPPPPPGSVAWANRPPTPPTVRGIPVSIPQSQPGSYRPRHSPPSTQTGPPPPLPAPVFSATYIAPTAPPAPGPAPIRAESISHGVPSSSPQDKAASAASTTPNGSNNNGRVHTTPSFPYYYQNPPRLNLNQNQQHQPSAVTGANSTARMYDVRLAIRWVGRGEQRVLESSRASVRALQEMGLAYVRTHADAFKDTSVKNSSSPDGSISHRNHQGHNNVHGSALRARLRQAFFGVEAYDMTTYRGDDLTKLFNVLSASGIPLFEIEVETVAPPRPAPPAPAMPTQAMV
ncbi:hypothetical protein GGS23DRAFT_10177 [Durotheca rogersii]|uniref:uncharacterized protein n=1 Tax=Durotheca rogersii TaxID=419775 RepID=UPI00221FA623|nr:uncharacterized protein GGS23DRAFT_10177 [Durotheca rogersii]KAI5868076.1 hypothetical protein GGS23DRAFT_10177 [Durotheca rogersii]